MRVPQRLTTAPGYFLVFLFAVGVSALVRGQVKGVIPLSEEPHHRLALHNRYVNVYEVLVAPHDTVLLHRHGADAISVMLDDAELSVRSPDKPDVHSKLTAGQIRLQPIGYVHSTTIDSEKPYRNITVELLRPQTGAKNGCAAVLANQPLNCADEPRSTANSTYSGQPQFQTNQTQITLYRIAPHANIPLSVLGKRGLVIALSPGLRRSTGSAAALQAGSFFWLEGPKSTEAIRNETEYQLTFVSFGFR
jgi:hypothetical protein